MADARSRPKLADDARNTLAQWLVQHSSHGKLHYGAKKEVCQDFPCGFEDYMVHLEVSSMPGLGSTYPVKVIYATEIITKSYGM